MTVRYVVIAVLILLAGCRPILMFPGGRLDGTVVPVPDDWSDLSEVKTIQLETRLADPYSVNIWVVGIGSQLYVHAGANRAAWVVNMEADPAVRVRVGDQLFALHGTRVEDAAEFARFSDVYETKYGRRPRNENVAEAWLFRLEAAAVGAVSER